MHSYSDIELWALIRQDDSGAFQTLYNKYWEKAYTVCYWHLLDQESAKDIIQELFVDLWDKRGQINIHDTVEGYLKVAVRNRVFNYIRSRNTRKRHYYAATKDFPEGTFSTEELNDERELRKRYQAEVEKLPLKMKEVYILIKENDLSIKQVAELLSLSEQTIKNQIVHALKKIRNGLEYYSPFLLLILYYFVF